MNIVDLESWQALSEANKKDSNSLWFWICMKCFPFLHFMSEMGGIHLNAMLMKIRIKGTAKDERMNDS